MGGENVFLAPVDGPSYERTVETAVAVDDHPDRPEPLADLESVRLDGVAATDANRTYFEKMAPGDLVLFHRDDRYVGVGYVGTTFEDTDRWTAATFWGDGDATLIFTVTEFSPVSVPRVKVHRLFEYTERYSPQGLTRVADSRVTNRLAAIKRAVEDVSS